MSVVMQLLRPVETACIGNHPDYISKMIWTDGKDHEYVNYSQFRVCYKKQKFWHRIHDKFVGTWYSHASEGINKGEIFIPFDTVEYAQGFFFKNRYFKRKDWLNVCNTKRGMIDFFNRYIDYSMDGSRETTNRFIDSWEDGMIFICSW